MLLEKYLNASEKHFNTIWIFLSTFICKKLIWWPHRTNTVAGRRAEIYFINTDWRTILPVCPFFKLSVMSDGIYPHALNHRWNSIAYTKYRSILFFIGEEEKGLQKWKKWDTEVCADLRCPLPDSLNIQQRNWKAQKELFHILILPYNIE